MIPNKLIVLEMANNHMGDVAHGFKVISDFGAVCRKFPEFKFAFKLQYRELDTFIHPSMRGRDDIKYIKRFSETKLTRENFDQLVSTIRKEGFLAMATPFDNASIATIVDQKLDILKIAKIFTPDLPNKWPNVKIIIAVIKGRKIDKIYMCFYKLLPPHQ
jgi:sialic acid synthase SpsE